ncbi:hypothetical protein O3M35_005265 [Rhynocoris fuscipes]|uniref:Apoptosis inhibitor 5 n=1 Tax=Rhynocoris fuscipes TaxID=488301 RepID=A0AAW1DHJ3_9HEMI
MSITAESEKVNRLYSFYESLSNPDGSSFEEREDMYNQIIRAVNGCSKEKRLACQFIPVFYKKFPALVDSALEAQLDLCEDTDVSIRKQAIKELPSMCRDCPKQTKKIIFILAQLLSTKCPSELRTAQAALLSLFKIDAKAVTSLFFSVIKTGNDIARNNCLLFLSSKFNDISELLKAVGAEQLLIKEIKNLLQNDVCLEEIPVLIKLLLSTERCSSIDGKNYIIEIIAEKIEKISPLDLCNDEIVECLIVFMKYAYIFQSEYKNVDCTKLVLVICEEILPHLSFISEYEKGSGYVLEILQILAEITSGLDELTGSEMAIKYVMKILLDFIPSSTTKMKDETIFLSNIECLLYVLHKFKKFNPTGLANNSLKFKKLRKKLQRLFRTVQGYKNALSLHLDIFLNNPNRKKGKRLWFQAVKVAKENECKASFFSVTELRKKINLKNVENISDNDLNYSQNNKSIKNMSEDKKNCLRAMAFDTCNNILILIEDFFKNPATCNAQVELSFCTRKLICEN